MMDFTERELKQIAHLWKQNMTGGRKIDRRVVSSKRVQEWAVSRGLAMWRCNHNTVCDHLPPWSYEYLDEGGAHPERPCEWRLEFRYGTHDLKTYWRFPFRRFTSEIDLPVEILWRYVKTFLYHEDGKEPRGFSVNYQRGWLDLNIYEMGSKWDKENKHHELRCKVLERLARAGLIYWQTAGSVWNIMVTEMGERVDA